MNFPEVYSATGMMELIVFDPIHHSYIQLGEKVGNAFSDGKALK